MSIKTDAHSILKYVVSNKGMSKSDISKYFNFDEDRTWDALIYLEQKGFISGIKAIGGYWGHIGATAQGIDFNDDLEEEFTKSKENLEKKESSETKGKSSEDINNRLDRIDNRINLLLSRPYRETTYYASLYSLIIASFIAIAFTTFVEFLNRVVPDKYKPILTLFYYFFIFIAIWIISFFVSKMRQKLDVDNYIATFEVRNKINKFELASKLRKIIEKNDHQLGFIIPRFEGFLYNDIIYFLRSRKVTKERKEEILKKFYEKETKGLYYQFDYVDGKNIISGVTLNFDKLRIELNLDKGVDPKIAHKVLNEIRAIEGIESIDKSGWDL